MTDEVEDWSRLVDRRGANRGDARREALLTAFDELLREQSLEAVNVADISNRAGVTRSAFYFYFESKAIAVMALMQDLYDSAAVANELLVEADGDAETRIRRAITGLFDSVDASPHTYRALLEARASSPAVRAMWITAERATPEGPGSNALASVLLDLNDHALERHSLGSGPPRDQHIDTLTFIWLRTIYGETN
jgi:AcrR family transcriptional regulator